MDYEVHNKNSLSYDIMLSNEVEYTNQLTNMDADNAVDKLLRDVAILKQEVAILEGDIATMKLDVKTHQKDIEMAQGQIRDINTRLGTIDLVIADIQERLATKASIEYVDGEILANQEIIENLATNKADAYTELLADDYDFDLIIKNGKYKVWRGLNAPTDTNCGWLIDVIAEDDNNLQQTATSYGVVEVSRFIRSRDGNGWTSWKEITTADSVVPMLNDLIAVIGMNLDTEVPKGWSHGFNCTGTLPNGYSADNNDFFIESIWNNPEYKQMNIRDIRSDRQFTRRMVDGQWLDWNANSGFGAHALDSTNIDTCRGNFTVGVTEGQGVCPDAGWNNIVQFDSEHFINQFTFALNDVDLRSIYCRSKWTGAQNFSDWKEISTKGHTHTPVEIGTIYTPGGYCSYTPTRDWNELTQCGFYMQIEAINAPLNSSNWFYGYVIAHNDLYAYQKLCDFGMTGKWYERICIHGNWGAWEEVISQTKVEITSDMMKNGWTLWGEGQWTNSIITTGENLSLNLMLQCGDLVEGAVIMEGLPIRTTQSFVSYTDNNNKQGLLMYCTDGTLIITTYGLPTNSVWITVDDVINI